jgi:hypothetical protein
MDERRAQAVAEALGGKADHMGGNIWLAILPQSDGRLIVISEDLIAEYRDEADFEAGNAGQAIYLIPADAT